MKTDILETKRLKYARQVLSTAQTLIANTTPSPVDGIILKTHSKIVEDLEDRAPRLLERDHMPKQIATDMLLSNARLTNRQRKTCQSARENHYVSVQTKEAGIYKVARKFSKATLQQLLKWRRRARKVIVLTGIESRAMLKNKSLSENKRVFLHRLLDARIEACQRTINTIQTELQSRPIAYSL